MVVANVDASGPDLRRFAKTLLLLAGRTRWPRCPHSDRPPAPPACSSSTSWAPEGPGECGTLVPRAAGHDPECSGTAGADLPAPRSATTIGRHGPERGRGADDGPDEGVLEFLAVRARLRELADRLVVEYAGALPAGQVIATVLQASRDLDRGGRLPPRTHLTTCESIVRRVLTERLARQMGQAIMAPGPGG